MKNIFESEVSEEMIVRINHLIPDTVALWGKMNVGQMLAHCNVTYELAFENKHKKPNFLMRFLAQTFAKEMVVGEKPYKKNSMTAPVFLVKEQKNFEVEKDRLVNYIKKTQQLGESYFENKESVSFGHLKATEWNNMFYKHLDHHLRQFGV